MKSEKPDRVDHIADALDDLTTTVEELQEEPPDGVSRGRIQALKRALDKARDAADDIEDEKP